MILTSIISWLLYHANQDPGHFKEEFFRIKNGLLHLYGTPDGKDLQVLPEKSCYSCNGTGLYVGTGWSGFDYTATCYHCNGSGIYLPEALVPLKRFKMGQSGYVFHQPVGERYTKHNLPPAYWVVDNLRIQGIIPKKRTAYSSEAKLWLFLLFSPLYFRKTLRLYRSFAPMDRGFWISLHRFYRHCESEIKRRRTHLDFDLPF